MNNIVETYLEFKSNNIYEYIITLAEEIKKVSKIPRQLNKLIYKYYDLFILSDKKVDYDFLKEKTGLNDEYEKLILFYLLIEFDFASKTEYQDKDLYEFYLFIVNSIMLFSIMEKNKIKEQNYGKSLSKILENTSFNTDFLFLLSFKSENLSKKYNDSLKKELKFNEMYNYDLYKNNYTKIKNSEDLYLEKFRYRNEKLYIESKKDLRLINNEYKAKLGLINLEMISVKILKDLFNEDNKTVFIKLDDDIITKKTNLDNFISMIKLKFLKQRIIFLVNTSLLDKYEERINSLILDGFNISYYSDCKLTSHSIYKNSGYLMVDYNYLDEAIEFSSKNNLELIVTKVNKNDINKLTNIKYIT